MKITHVAVAAVIALVVVPQAIAYEPAGASLWTAKVTRPDSRALAAALKSHPEHSR